MLVLDASCRRVCQVSANLTELTGLEWSGKTEDSVATLLGKRLAKRVEDEMRGAPRLPGPLAFSRLVQGRRRRFQLNALRSGDHVLAELEPLHTSSKRRLLGTVNESLMQLAEAPHQEALLDSLVHAIRQLTGHDRVVVCHFDSDWHGLMLAQASSGKLPGLLGQRFPASDFPLSLRRSYERTPVRKITDAQAPPVTLLPSTSGINVDVMGSLLRAPAPERQAYLARMGVRGSLSLAMQGDAGLWGLVICHSATPHPVPPSIRDAVRALVQMATQRLLLLRARQEARYLERVQDSLALPAPQEEPYSPAQLLQQQAATWLELFRSTGVALCINGKVISTGKVPASAVIEQLTARLETAHAHNRPWCSRNLRNDPVARTLPLGNHCGAMAIPLAMNPSQRTWLVFFRPEQVETLYWAMQPTEASGQFMMSTDLARSAAWREEVVGKSEAWQRVERLAAVDLGEDLTLAISAYEISTLNAHLQTERQALAKANQRLEQLAHFDPLTQVWNRYRIEQAIDAELVAAQRYGTPFCLLLFDVDNFKAINDTYGHALGDDVLVALAALVEGSLRGCDHLGRWGGEEFIVLATHSDLEAAVGLAERLRTLIASLEVTGLEQSITVSIGLADWHAGDSCKTMIGRADAAMYRAKRSGRNRVELAQGTDLEPGAKAP
ncbi:diguanylate cyclase [Vreelandella rituensis]|uniref:diguanylate cyclase n=2 Tax=Vreelandella rituensis TaxID=2282306 RepID=A0A368UA83_9GAMM|nr:diguanylate cyclase [Halomonas rituensis]